MENQLVQSEVFSPDELREALKKAATDSQERFAAVRVVAAILGWLPLLFTGKVVCF
jgi:hypothetical protein